VRAGQIICEVGGVSETLAYFALKSASSSYLLKLHCKSKNIKMIQLGSLLHVTDQTVVSLVQCIKVVRNSKHRIAKIGQIILILLKE